jgi:ribosomal protein L37AE/L43A
MSRPVASCPSCGAPVQFRWSSAVQTVCGYCQSVLVRTGMDLRDVGRKSSPPPSVTPVQLGTRGVFDGRGFEVVGRIVYGYERGHWNEWHLAFDDGGSCWLSDALAEYAVTFAETGESAAQIPAASALRPGQPLRIAQREYVVGSVTSARYAGTEGELPFEYWDKTTLPFADLKGPEGDRFATLDYSEQPPLVFAGRYVDFEELKLSNLREVPEGPEVRAETFACPSCGGTVEVRLRGTSVNVVCRFCSSVLDASAPKAKVLQTFQSRLKREPKIPLGARGRLHGADWTVLGFQVRTIRVEGVDYAWDEYLLHNPARGFRYLTEYRGHWNDAMVVRGAPTVTRGGHARARFRGQSFKHFQTATAETTFVLGEFPWEVRVGDKALVQDYVRPPLTLSMEEVASPPETTWTLSEYLPPSRIQEAFGLEKKLPRPVGVYANQPSPHGHTAAQMWKGFAALLSLLLVFWIARAASTPPPVAAADFEYDPGLSEDARGATMGPFTLGGRTSNVSVRLSTDVDNQWAYFNFALVEETTGKVVTFGREVSFYSGVEDGERWTEGDRDEAARVGSVPPGRYRLFIEPEGPSPVRYSVSVKRDVPAHAYFFVTLLLISLPPLVSLVVHGSFEGRRWSESDYASDDDD